MNPEQQTEQSVIRVDLQEIMSHPCYRLALEIAIVKQSLIIKCLEYETHHKKDKTIAYSNNYRNFLTDLYSKKDVSKYLNIPSPYYIDYFYKTINPEAVQQHAEDIPGFDELMLNPENKLHFMQDHAVLNSQYLLRTAAEGFIKDYDIRKVHLYMAA